MEDVLIDYNLTNILGEEILKKKKNSHELIVE